LFLGTDTAKNALDLLDKHLIDALNEMIKNSNNEPIHSSTLDFNQLTKIIKQTFLRLDKELVGLVNDLSGSVCVSFFLIKIKMLINSFVNI